MRSARKTAEALVAQITKAQQDSAKPQTASVPSGLVDVTYPAGTYGGYPVAGATPPDQADAPPGMVRR
jgi:hypothetical protein